MAPLRWEERKRKEKNVSANLSISDLRLICQEVIETGGTKRLESLGSKLLAETKGVFTGLSPAEGILLKVQKWGGDYSGFISETYEGGIELIERCRAGELFLAESLEGLAGGWSFYAIEGGPEAILELIGSSKTELEKLLHKYYLESAYSCLSDCRNRAAKRGREFGWMYCGGAAVRLHELVPASVSCEEIGTTEEELLFYHPYSQPASKW